MDIIPFFASVSLTLNLSSIIAWVIIGCLAGAIVGSASRSRLGIAGNTMLGFLGTFSGIFVVVFLHVDLDFYATLLVAVAGSSLLVVAVRLLTGTREADMQPVSSQQSSSYTYPSYAPPVVAAPRPKPLYSGPLRIFVSHSHADNAWCRVFVDGLKSQGCDVWYDEQGLGGGAIWQKRIVEELQSRPFFVVILSPDATNSQWVDEEIQLALSARRYIIPIHHRQTTIVGFLNNRQIVDVRGMNGQAAARLAVTSARQLVS